VHWKSSAGLLLAASLASHYLGARAAAADDELRLKIISPAPATTVIAGSTITVKVVSDTGAVLDTVLVVGKDQVGESSQPPFNVAFEVPRNAFGPYDIAAFGKNKRTGELFQSASVSLQVEADAVLQSLRIPGGSFVYNVESMTIRVGDQEHLSLVGRFSDGIDRHIPLSLVTWASGNTDLLSVDAAGLASGLAPGKTTLRASALGLEGSIGVLVFVPRNE